MFSAKSGVPEKSESNIEGGL